MWLSLLRSSSCCFQVLGCSGMPLLSRGVRPGALLVDRFGAVHLHLDDSFISRFGRMCHEFINAYHGLSLTPVRFLHRSFNTPHPSSLSILFRCLFEDLVIPPVIIIQLYTHSFLPGYDTYNTYCASSSNLFLFLDTMHRGRFSCIKFDSFSFFLVISSHTLIPLRRYLWRDCSRPGL